MTRGLSSANQAAITAQVVRPVVFVELHFDSPTGAIRLHSGLGDLTATDFDGVSQTFLGVGDLGRVDEVREGQAINPYKLSLTLSGLDTTLASEVKDANAVLRPVKLQHGYLSAAHQLLANPHKLWRGRINEVNMVTPQSADGLSAIEVVAESFLIALQRANGRLFNDAEQQGLFSGDLGFEYGADVEDIKLIWGGQSVSYGGAPGGSFVGGGVPQDGAEEFLR